MKYPDSSVYVVGNSKSQQNNPITHVYGSFFISIVIDSKNDIILDAECNVIIPLTNEFIKTIFVGKNIAHDFESIKKEIEKRYLGSSQKAILVAFKDAQKKYLDFKSGKEVVL